MCNVGQIVATMQLMSVKLPKDDPLIVPNYYNTTEKIQKNNEIN